MFKGLSIASAGMSAQRARLHVISSNLANASTTRTEDGGPYKRREAVFRTTLPEGWQEAMKGDEPGKASVGMSLRGVEVSDVQHDPIPGPLVFDPGHPDADENGNVEMPNVNPVEEMVDMIAASRSFEANAQSFQTLRDMVMRALDIGR
ncbi:MAG: flagellar basal body rod protein FlgC [Myxococcota bacterium]|nr:flagellar basal body rod protein FlgC [Myxococcota bacterium]